MSTYLIVPVVVVVVAAIWVAFAAGPWRGGSQTWSPDDDDQDHDE